MAEVIHDKGWKWLSLENDNSPSTKKNKRGSSKRPAEISKIRKYKKWLRSWWLETKPNEKEQLKILYEVVKESLRTTWGWKVINSKGVKIYFEIKSVTKFIVTQHGQLMSVLFWRLSAYLLKKLASFLIENCWPHFKPFHN